MALNKTAICAITPQKVGGYFSLWYRFGWCWVGKWHTNVQLTLKQMRTAVLELTFCQTKRQLWIQHPAWLSVRKPTPNLAALLYFSTTGGLYKAIEWEHENQLLHFLFQHQRCKEASTQPRNGAMSQLGVSEHLIDTLTQIEYSGGCCWGQLSGSFTVCPLCYALKLKSVTRVLCEAGMEVPVLWSTLSHLHQCCALHIWESSSWFTKCVTQTLPLCLVSGCLGWCWDCGNSSCPSHGWKIKPLHLSCCYQWFKMR